MFTSLRLPPWRLACSRWPWLVLLYLGSGVLLAIPTFVCLLAFPLLPAWVQVLSEIEVRRLAILAPGPQGPLAPWRTWSWPAVWQRMRSVASWRQAALATVHAAVAIVVFVLAALWVTAGGTAYRLAAGEGLSLVGQTRFLVTDVPAQQAVLAAGTVLIAVPVLGYVTLAVAAMQAAATTALTEPDAAAVRRQVVLLSDANLALSDAFEAERRRIERELHDGPQQHLTITGMQIGLARAELARAELARSAADGDASGARRADELLAVAQDELDRAVDSLRAALEGLRPRALVEEGLVVAIEEMTAHAPIAVTISATLERRLPAAMESSLLFVVAEFLTNAYRHSAAATVRISIQDDGAEVRLSLEDDGHGGADPLRGTGLTGIHHRAALLGGSAHLSSPAGGPTRLEVRCPVPSAALPAEPPAQVMP